MKLTSLVLLGLFAGTAAFADSHADPFAASGDAEAGAAAFKRQCISCHVIVDDQGEKLAGRNAKTGPNLYGQVGRQAGSVEGFRYSKDLAKAGEEAGLVWTEDTLVAFIQNPTAALREVTGNNRARSKMSFMVRKEQDAINIFAYLATMRAAN